MTNSKQKTAVDSIIEFCQKQMDNDSSIHKGVYLSIIKFCKEQAKEMEKEKAIKLYIDYENYLHEEFKHQNGGQAVILSFREFYNKTYGGGEQ
jgi:hypothetical protein